MKICPIIISGGGVLYSEAENELSVFAKKHNIPVTFLSKQEDVDNLDDLISVFKILKKSKDLLPKQKNLYNWLKSWAQQI